MTVDFLRTQGSLHQLLHPWHDKLYLSGEGRFAGLAAALCSMSNVLLVSCILPSVRLVSGRLSTQGPCN